MKTLLRIVLLFAAVVLLSCLAHLDRYIWSEAHPNAPDWTYYFTR